VKKLIWNIVLPLTIIAFSIFTKWWYVIPNDAPDTMMIGFPLIWMSEGWHTSLSLQIFVGELIVNLVFYFLVLYFLFFAINRFFAEIKVSKFITIIMYSIVGLICFGAIWIGTMPEHIYKAKRDFDIEILDSGYHFIWEDQERPNYENYKK